MSCRYFKHITLYVKKNSQPFFISRIIFFNFGADKKVNIIL